MKTLLAALLLLLSAHSAHADGVGSLTGVGRHATTGGCSQATTFLARTSGLNATHTNAYTTLICGMVTDGTWCGSLFDAFYILATQDSATALLNLCSTSLNLTANGSPTFTADAGFTGVDASATVYLDSGANLSTYTNLTLNSAHISGWSFTNTTSSSNGGNIAGAISTGFAGVISITAKYSDGNAYCDVNDNSDPGGANADSTGWYVCDRSDSTHSTLYRNATSIRTPNVTSTSIPSSTHNIILAAGFEGGSINGASAIQVAMASIGAHLTSAQITAIYNRVCTYLTTVHGSC